ncbi:hypothetical protein PuT2_14005 [Pusillimonas sp. T2]|uniref:hypothetical protein n=1 Tax=Pusillimonas sp. T2 TaxID=1548123 RepID=UPI000B9C9F62|nr:hypothetical protein [Pusillimonas sp. T2]OXR48133.1 hypothetical protein PuT2_14005 [Pusillimonas sp. T2]
MNTEQLRAEFESELGRGKTYNERDFQMFLLGRRAALQSQDREDAPWDDLKVAFGCDDDEALWKAVESEKIHFPKGWKLIETDGSGARVVAIFRVDRIPTVADGESVRAAIDHARRVEGEA